jgi:Protein of unknown function (DUF1566)
MSLPYRTSHRIAAAVATACAGLALASAAEAVDLRDWGRKFPVNERFVVLSQFSNQAVLDKETQLVWQRTPSVGSLANSNSRNLTAYECRQSTSGGRRGWRLPSLHEMASLTDPAAPAGTLALPPGHPFTAVPNGEYWTATQQHGAPDQSYVVNLSAKGGSGTRPDSHAAYFWCVRGGGPISEY